MMYWASLWLVLCACVLAIGRMQCVAWSSDQLEVLEALVEQVRAQELYVAERIRSEGHSGIKQVRLTRSGVRPYFAPSHAHRNVASMHNHANNIQTVGLGEFIAVLNGVEFRTRHNDYGLKMPSTSSQRLHEVQDIPLPDVPQAVLDHDSLEDQVNEMQQWFKAWRDQDYTVRDYRQYFKPVLCYLEGAWFSLDSVELDGFTSDRHFIDARDYQDLIDKIRYTSEAGRKSNLENFSYLPIKIIGFENGTLQLAQWNYRIVCHPLQRDVPLNRLRAVDDITNRMAYSLSWYQYLYSKGARFQVNQDDSDTWSTHPTTRGYLDELMEEIPGKNNYGGVLHDDALDATAYELNTEDDTEDIVKNAAYYHRWFRVQRRGAMGLNVRHRGFSDENLFMALTDHHQVVPTTYTRCTGPDRNEVCETVAQRWTYAIPLELIYLTPLQRWNYYNIPYRGEAGTVEGGAIFGTGELRRIGLLDIDRAFNGTNSKNYYITPSEFYEGNEILRDPADTTRATIGMLDGEGNLRDVKASGIRILLPNIPGVGILRQRYPIMPVHGEGSSVWKELEVLKDIVLNPSMNGWMLHDGDREPTTNGITLELGEGATGHTHHVYLRATDIAMVQSGETLWIDCEPNGGHEHRLELTYFVNQRGDGEYYWATLMPYERHPKKLHVVQYPDPDTNTNEL